MHFMHFMHTQKKKGTGILSQTSVKKLQQFSVVCDINFQAQAATLKNTQRFETEPSILNFRSPRAN